MDIKVMIIYSFGGKCWQNGLMPMSVLCRCFRSNIPTNDQSSFFFFDGSDNVHKRGTKFDLKLIINFITSNI